MTTDTSNVFCQNYSNVEAGANQQHTLTVSQITAPHPTYCTTALVLVPRIIELHHSNTTQLQEETTHFCHW